MAGQHRLMGDIAGDRGFAHLAPLFANDGEGQERRWTFRGVIDSLAHITRNRVTVNGAEFYQNSTPTPEQEEILGLLQVTIGSRITD
jgi:hypothetical protein